MAHLLDWSNGSEYGKALTRLPVKPGDVVLELGFGGGVGLRGLLDQGARVVGVEPAIAMRVRAIRKLAQAMAEGRLEVRDGRAEALPDGPFDHALSMNTVYFWDDVPAAMAELARTVRDTVVLGVGPTDHLNDMGFREEGYRVEEPNWYAARLADAGFEVSIEPLGPPVHSSLVVGRKPVP